MASLWTRCLRLLVLLPLGLTAASNQLSKRAQKPSTDPFYQPPAGFESTAPGTILRNRTVIAAVLGLIPEATVETHQLLYRTTAINGSAIAGVTTVFKPVVGAMTDRFVSFHTAYDGSSTLCNPSYSYQLLSEQLDAITSLEFLVAEAFIKSGYIVSAPDYEGPDAAFGAGRLAGTVILDSMRAVTNFKNTLGFTTPTPKIVGIGYSGGAIGTGWAASLHPTYAPELPVQGWVQGGTPANLTGTAVNIDNTAFSGFLPDAVNGLKKPSAYGAQINPIIESIITPFGQGTLDFAEENCVADLLNFAEQSILTVDYQSLGDRLFYDPQIAAVMEQTVMGVNENETPTAPVYLYHATLDEIIPYSNASVLVDAWCADGASVDFVTYAAGGHLTTEVVGFPGVYSFVQAAFAGTVASGCSRSVSFNNTLDPLALGLDLEPFLLNLLDALAAFGRQDKKVMANLNVLNTTIPT